LAVFGGNRGAGQIDFDGKRAGLRLFIAGKSPKTGIAGQRFTSVKIGLFYCGRPDGL